VDGAEAPEAAGGGSESDRSRAGKGPLTPPNGSAILSGVGGAVGAESTRIDQLNAGRSARSRASSQKKALGIFVGNR